MMHEGQTETAQIASCRCIWRARFLLRALEVRDAQLREVFGT